jgi:hypothetical protein
MSAVGGPSIWGVPASMTQAEPFSSRSNALAVGDFNCDINELDGAARPPAS